MRLGQLLTWSLLLMCAIAPSAAGRDHTAVFGEWMTVKLFVGPDRDRSIDMNIRPLYIDGGLKEFTTGQPHDISEMQFVVRRVYRSSDRLVRNGEPQAFLWQRGGWILVDRSRGRVSALDLPEFDPFYSVASWSQDWAAYCGISREGTQVYGIVAKLDQRNPIVRKRLREATGVGKPDGECEAPRWERQPGHVTFLPIGGEPVTIEIGAERAD